VAEILDGATPDPAGGATDVAGCECATGRAGSEVTDGWLGLTGDPPACGAGSGPGLAFTVGELDAVGRGEGSGAAPGVAARAGPAAVEQSSITPTITVSPKRASMEAAEGLGLLVQ